MIWLVYLLLGIGTLFQILGTLALHRFPDVYTRMHGATKCTTFGSLFIYIGVIIYGIIMYVSGEAAYASLSLHTFVVMIFILVTNPTGAHALARAAHRSGVMPERAIVDRLRGESK
jgi:multicomponent Na+:H+ antiporter subunit G